MVGRMAGARLRVEAILISPRLLFGLEIKGLAVKFDGAYIPGAAQHE